MAKQTTAGFNVDVFGSEWDAVKGEETQYSKFGDLPGGIKNGIALLTECKIGQYEKGDNEGEYFFYAHASVVHPVKHAGIKIKGKLTKIGPEALCETKKQDGTVVTKKEHMSKFANELRKLGVKTENLTPQKVVPAMNALLKKEVYFRFDTRGWTPPNSDTERVFHEWNGRLEADEMEDLQKLLKEQESGVDEDTGEGPLSDVEIEELVEKAKENDGPAKKELERRAVAAGYSSDEVQDADDWDDVASMIDNPKKKDKKKPSKKKPAKKKEPEPEPEEEEEQDEEEQEDEDEGEEESEDEDTDEDDGAWNVGDTVKFKPPKRGGGYLKKPADCEVMEIDEEKETCTLKNLSTDKLYKGVELSRLEV